MLRQRRPVQRNPLAGRFSCISDRLRAARKRCRKDGSYAAALKAQGVMIHRYTKKEHKPRGIFCAIGRCTDCVMVVNGKPNIRTCVTPLEEGMKVQTQYGVSDKPFEEQ